MKMTTLRSAAERALEALEYYRSGEDYQPTPASDAVVALREALAQPEQGPVADTESDVLTATYMLGLHAGKKATNRQPLTEEQIKPIFDQWKILYGGYTIDFIRAIERAHGIKEEK